MPKFNTMVPGRLNDTLGLIKLRETKKRGLAIAYALHLARLKPDHPQADFGSDRGQTCNLGMENDELALFTDFRENHKPVLSTNVAFFEAGLWIGCSLYADGYRLSEQINHKDADLLAPPPKSSSKA